MLTENRVSSACQLHDPSAWVEVTESGDAILQPMLQEPPNEVVVERAGWLLFGDEKTFQFKSDDQPSPVGHYPDRVQKDLEVGGKQRVPNEASRTRSRDVLKMPSVQSSRPRALRYSTWKILAVVLLGWMGWGTLHNPRDPEARKQLQGLQAELDMLSSRIADNEHTVENLKQEIEKKDSTNRADRKAFDEKLREEQNGRKQEEKELKAQLDKLQREISDQAAPRTQPWWGP